MPVSAELTQTESRGRGKNQAWKQKDPSMAQFTRSVVCAPVHFLTSEARVRSLAHRAGVLAAARGRCHPRSTPYSSWDVPVRWAPRDGSFYSGENKRHREGEWLT